MQTVNNCKQAIANVHNVQISKNLRKGTQHIFHNISLMKILANATWLKKVLNYHNLDI